MELTHIFNRFFFVIFLFGTSLVFNNNVNSEPIKIGVSIPLTGEGAIYGAEMRDFFEFANHDLANKKYQLVFEDDRCNGKDSLAVAQKLINIDKIKYVIGFACSSTILTTVPEYARGNVVAMATYASSPRIKDAGPHVYRTAPSDEQAGKLLGEYIVKSKIKNLGVISDQTDYTQDLLNALRNSVQGSELIIHNEDYLPNSTDFRSILLKLKQKSPEAIFINPQLENTFLLILNQILQMNWKPQIFGAYWPGSSSLIEQAKEKMEGVVFVDTPTLKDILKGDGPNILARFKAWGGKIRSTESNFATSYEGFRALHQAIEANNGINIQEYLNKTTFNGIFGEWSFDQDGEIQGIGFVIKKINDNKSINVASLN